MPAAAVAKDACKPGNAPMGRYVVTGGAGFIGAALARRLIADGHNVVIIDDLSTGFRDNIPDGAAFVAGDAADPATIKSLPKGRYDAVLHLAAQSSGAIGQKDPYRDMASNVGSTVQLIKWCRETGVRRFLYASSMTVYGSENSEPAPEDAVLIPISYYGAGKLASEHYLRVSSVDGLDCTALRLYNVYGPGQNLSNRQQGMASIYLAYMLDGVAVPVTGSLERYRDFCYVDDVVDAFLCALSVPKTKSLAYNIGTGRKTTVRQLLAHLVDAMGLPRGYPIQQMESQKADIFGSVAMITRAETELGWRPHTSLEQGLAQMVAWAKKAHVAPR